MKVLIAESRNGSGGPIVRFFTTASFHDNPDFPLAVEAVHLGETLPQVLEIFNKEHPDVILINADDLESRALELCLKIRELEGNRHAGIIFYSEKATDLVKVDLEKALESGADDLIDRRVTDHEFMARVHAVYRFKVMTDRLRSANHRLKQLSLTDELTGLSNMRAFNIDYQKLVKNTRDGKHGLGLLMFDLDRFKSVNDTSNHLMGSFVIAEIGHLLLYSGVLPEGALAARYGGDEYIIAVPSNGIREVWEIADKLHDLILRSVFKKDQFSFKLTASFGVAWAEPAFEGKSDDLIRASDLMLYRSKRLGRSQVNGLILRYPIDFDDVGKPHIVERSEIFPDSAVKKNVG